MRFSLYQGMMPLLETGFEREKTIAVLHQALVDVRDLRQVGYRSAPSLLASSRKGWLTANAMLEPRQWLLSLTNTSSSGAAHREQKRVGTTVVRGARDVHTRT